MSARLFAAALATGTAFVASGVSAQQIYYEDGDYLYAVPGDAVVTETVTETVDTPQAAIVLPPLSTSEVAQPVYSYDPVVQPLPDAADPTVISAGADYPSVGAVRSIPARAKAESYRGASYSGASHPADAYPAANQTPYPVYQGSYAYTAAPRSGYLPGGGQLVSFDREAWLAECRARVGTYEDSDRARLIGTLVGAAAGGVIGNRVAGSGDRLVGTLIGAGTGAAAGSLVGDAIDDRNDTNRYAYGDDGGYCAAYLNDYLARASQTAATVTTTNPGQQYFLVPVTVRVAQQPVYAD